MLSFAGSLKVFVAAEPCDLRQSFDGLYALVTERLQESPQTKELFVFTNRLKLLFWDRTSPRAPLFIVAAGGHRSPG